MAPCGDSRAESRWDGVQVRTVAATADKFLPPCRLLLRSHRGLLGNPAEQMSGNECDVTRHHRKTRLPQITAKRATNLLAFVAGQALELKMEHAENGETFSFFLLCVFF